MANCCAGKNRAISSSEGLSIVLPDSKISCMAAPDQQASPYGADEERLRSLTQSIHQGFELFHAADFAGPGFDLQDRLDGIGIPRCCHVCHHLAGFPAPAPSPVHLAL